MLNKINFRCYSYQVKRRFYGTNDERVSTMIVSAKRVYAVFGVRSILAYLFVVDK